MDIQQPKLLSGPLSFFGRAAIVVLVVSALLLGCAQTQPIEDAGQKPWPFADTAPAVTSTSGLVVSGHPLASEVGADVLASGGSAIDAAVATGFALAVVLPTAGNLGGGGFLVYRPAPDENGDAEVETLDYREKAPGAASHDMYLDDAGEPTDRSVIGHLASGVPGSVAGLWSMHQRHGTLPWGQLVEPAIELAREHLIDESRHNGIKSAAKKLARFETSAAKFLPGGEPLPVGSTWSQPELAFTLEQIRDGGRDGFYLGPVAGLIVAEMERGSGIMSHEDLAAYEPVWREPIEIDYRGYTLFSMPPPSSGGITMALILNILEGFELPAPDTSALVHLEAEAMRRAFIDRNRYLGDPDFVELPLDRLQSQQYADTLRAEIDPERASITPADLFAPVESTETTHYSIVDAQGAAVSITTTINAGFGSGVTVAGAGFLLNNEMDDFATAPGKPNMFGLVESENNSVAPHKRMLSSMSPSILLNDAGELHMVVGSPGGPTIITSVMQVISNVIDHGMELGPAVEQVRLHHQALPDKLFVEKEGLSPAVQSDLRGMGHELVVRGGYSGDVAAILATDPGFVGVADPRRGGGVAAATVGGSTATGTASATTAPTSTDG